MTILITGATGLIGQELIRELTSKGHKDLRVVTTNTLKAKKKMSHLNSTSIQFFEWDLDTMSIEAYALKDVDIIIHLAGESVATGRWTKSKKNKILQSRIKGTALLLQEIKKYNYYPKHFISSSAIGFYGDRNDEILDQTSLPGEGFLADVCKRWESTLLEENIGGMSKSIIRTGLVLSAEGGALSEILPPFKLGVGGTLGSGKQYMSWIHIKDLVNIFLYSIDHPDQISILNAVSPNPVTNNEFTLELGKTLNKPTFFKAPSFVLKLALGEKSHLLLDSQRVVPSSLVEKGFIFSFPTLTSAFQNIL